MNGSNEAPKTFRETLKEAMRAKSVSAAKLAELTDITAHYIQALIDNDTTKLPPAPYVHGYIVRIAEVLDVDTDGLWRQYKHDDNLKRSGENDTLPSNRFAHKTISKRMVALIIVALIILAYAIPHIASFFGKPLLAVSNPPTDNYITAQYAFSVEGTVGNPQDKVTINGEEIMVNQDGSFKKEVALQEGQNTYTIVAKRFLGRSSSITRTIWLQATSTVGAPTLPQATTTSTTAPTSSSGR